MSISERMLIALAVVAMLILVRWVRRNRRIASEKAWLPKGLQDAELIYAEQVFRAMWPVRIIAKLDRGYRDAQGLIVLLELKTRRASRPYLSDVIELSAQRFAVAAQTKEIVADHGYVLVQQPGSERRKSYRVQLLTHDEVNALVKRREAILAGWEEAQYAHALGL
ncbi:MAG: hypothetical protein WCA45_16450, partial [Thiobacillaceae bacterium]